MSPTRLLIASALFGSLAFSTAAAPLTPEDAAGHIGETATVCGVVASAKYEANAKSQPTLLDLGKAGQAHLRDGEDQRLPREAGDRSDRAEPVDPIGRAARPHGRTSIVKKQTPRATRHCSSRRVAPIRASSSHAYYVVYM
jgi:hypothetical protein